MSDSKNAVSSVCRTRLRTGDLAYRRGDFGEAVKSYESVRKHAAKTGEHHVQSIALIKCAICYSALNRLRQAEKLILQSTAIEESQHVLDIDDAVLLHHELSILLFRLDRFQEGYAEEKKALELLQKSEPINNTLLVSVLKQLVVYASREEQYDLASGLLDDAISVTLGSPELGEDSPLYGQLLALSQSLEKR